MNDYKTDQLNNLDIKVDNDIKRQFAEAAKWSKFISVLVFVFAGIFLLVGILASSFIIQALEKSDRMGALGGLSGAIISVIIVVVVALFSVNYFFLYKFATKIKQALATEDQHALAEALGALKIFFIISSVISVLSILNSIADLF
jgi:hypothetical protein